MGRSRLDRRYPDPRRALREHPSPGYGEHYRKVVRALGELHQQGIAAVDILDVFADEKGTIYADDIHPYAPLAARAADTA